ncbi:cyclophilin-like fold protein [Cohaesibacter haloalkalitolerans]|uniref:cyclophilin-like fold protein n=1 Tax=Cohaesibacter haloalkalitolerans TaxID=1162980 RepID=UPI000E65B96F|nr:cyclophilin-like fold protein [Cohaesibacter haloalkalitolerans]
MSKIFTRSIANLCVLFVLASAWGVSPNTSQAVAQQRGTQHLNIRIGNMIMTATTEDNPTARDFVELLPLTLSLRDFSAAEKVSGALPNSLSEEGAPVTDAGTTGDIAYYAPWKNIAFYRGRGPNAAGVIRIARITSNADALNQSGDLSVTISLSE